MAWQPFRILLAEELHSLVATAISGGIDPCPSVETCSKYSPLAPMSPLGPIIPRGRLDFAKKARTHAAALSAQIPTLTDFYRILLLKDAERVEHDEKRSLALNKDYRSLFQSLEALQHALTGTERWLQPIDIGPREHWHQAAQKLQAFFDAVVSECNPNGPYGLSLVGPTTRFVLAALKELGWQVPEKAALLKHLQEIAPAGRTRKRPGRRPKK